MATTKPNRTPLNVSLPPGLAKTLEAFCEERLLAPSKVIETALQRLFASQVHAPIDEQVEPTK